MIKLSINLPIRYRLDLNLVKSRGSSSMGNPLLPSIKEIKSIRSGSKLSRYFRLIFEHKNIRKILGSNLAIITLASSIVNTSTPINAGEAEINVIREEKVTFLTEKSVRYPVEKVIISQGFHFFHPGIDLDGLTGDPINPIMPGIVKDVQFSRFAYGNAILIEHENGLESLYAHLNKINVKKGDKVTVWTKIGEMGATGRAFGDHLHLEVYSTENGQKRVVNPFSILPRQ